MDEAQVTAELDSTGDGALQHPRNFSPLTSTDGEIKIDLGNNISDIRSSVCPIIKNSSELARRLSTTNKENKFGSTRSSRLMETNLEVGERARQEFVDDAQSRIVGQSGSLANLQDQDSKPLGGHDKILGDFTSFSLPVGDRSEPYVLADGSTSVVGSEAPQIQAYAKLEFDDGFFYMNTHAVELGRDIHAARRALQQELQGPKLMEKPQSSGSRHRSNSSIDASQAVSKAKIEENPKVASSIVSESGGIFNYERERSTRSRGRKSKSEGSVSHRASRRNSVAALFNPAENQNSAALTRHGPANDAQPVNLIAHLSSLDGCPLVPIHPPTADGTMMGHRGISRRHVRIAYNFERRLFEMTVQGRNGAFVDEEHYRPGQTADLRNRSYITIGGVGIRFILPNVPAGETGAEGNNGSEGVSAMSFEFEDGRGESIAMAESSGSKSSEDEANNSVGNDGSARPYSDDGYSSNSDIEAGSGSDEDEGEEDVEDEEEDQIKSPLSSLVSRARIGSNVKSTKTYFTPKVKIKLKTTSKSKPNENERKHQRIEDPSKPEVDAERIKELGIDIPLSMIPPRRKGPGRPPKNGFMSKREEASLKKQAREAAKVQAAVHGGLSPEAIKTSLEASEKRKYLKRKEKPIDDFDIRESIEGADLARIFQMSTQMLSRPTKEKKPPKPPKSPSPVIAEASLTAEQLAKPQQSYVVLIHEALSNCSTGQMSLPQIYKAIERRYPYFRFKVQTVGWQSSIRHNLSQHGAFRRVEREGKGWMWGLVPEVSIEKEKRPRRPSPPTIPQQAYYAPGPQIYRTPFHFQGAASSTSNASPTGQAPFMFPPPLAGAFPPAQAVKGPNGLPLPLVRPQNDSGSTYQSPYTSAPLQAQSATGITNGPVQAPVSQSSPDNNASELPNVPAAAVSTGPFAPPMTTQPQQLMSAPVQRHPSAHEASLPGYPQGQEVFSQRGLEIIDNFKRLMTKSLSSFPDAEQIVDRAVKRTLGLPMSAEESAKPESSVEPAIISAVGGLLVNIRQTEPQELLAERKDIPTKTKPNELNETTPIPQNTSTHPNQRILLSSEVPCQPDDSGSARGPPSPSPGPQNVSLRIALAIKDSTSSNPIPSPITTITSSDHKQNHVPTKNTLSLASTANPEQVKDTSPSSPLPQAEKNGITSLLTQLNQKIIDPPPGDRQGSSDQVFSINGGHPLKNNISTASRGLKRRFQDEEQDESPEKNGWGVSQGSNDEEGSRSKRVAI